MKYTAVPIILVFFLALLSWRYLISTKRADIDLSIRIQPYYITFTQISGKLTQWKIHTFQIRGQINLLYLTRMLLRLYRAARSCRHLSPRLGSSRRSAVAGRRAGPLHRYAESSRSASHSGDRGKYIHSPSPHMVHPQQCLDG